MIIESQCTYVKKKERKRKKKRGEKGCGEDVEDEFWRVRDESELWEGKNHPAI